jgi:hypothetical protein
MKNIIKMLADYDPYYVMTDDHRRYDEGLQLENKIKQELKGIELAAVLNKLDRMKDTLTTLKNNP